MTERRMTGRRVTDVAQDDERRELARSIDSLMANPAAKRPAITVVGDEDVFAINPAPRPS